MLRRPKRDKVLLPPYNPLPIEVHRRRRRRLMSVLFALALVFGLVAAGIVMR